MSNQDSLSERWLKRFGVMLSSRQHELLAPLDAGTLDHVFACATMREAIALAREGPAPRLDQVLNTGPVLRTESGSLVDLSSINSVSRLYKLKKCPIDLAKPRLSLSDYNKLLVAMAAYIKSTPDINANFIPTQDELAADMVAMRDCTDEEVLNSFKAPIVEEILVVTQAGFWEGIIHCSGVSYDFKTNCLYIGSREFKIDRYARIHSDCFDEFCETVKGFTTRKVVKRAMSVDDLYGSGYLACTYSRSTEDGKHSVKANPAAKYRGPLSTFSFNSVRKHIDDNIKAWAAAVPFSLAGFYKKNLYALFCAIWMQGFYNEESAMRFNHDLERLSKDMFETALANWEPYGELNTPAKFAQALLEGRDDIVLDPNDAIRGVEIRRSENTEGSEKVSKHIGAMPGALSIPEADWKDTFNELLSSIPVKGPTVLYTNSVLEVDNSTGRVIYINNADTVPKALAGHEVRQATQFGRYDKVDKAIVVDATFPVTAAGADSVNIFSQKTNRIVRSPPDVVIARYACVKTAGIEGSVEVGDFDLAFNLLDLADVYGSVRFMSPGRWHSPEFWAICSDKLSVRTRDEMAREAVFESFQLFMCARTPMMIISNGWMSSCESSGLRAFMPDFHLPGYNGQNHALKVLTGWGLHERQRYVGTGAALEERLSTGVNKPVHKKAAAMAKTGLLARISGQSTSGSLGPRVIRVVDADSAEG
jgi:hypothetical protein